MNFKNKSLMNVTIIPMIKYFFFKICITYHVGFSSLTFLYIFIHLFLVMLKLCTTFFFLIRNRTLNLYFIAYNHICSIK